VRIVVIVIIVVVVVVIVLIVISAVVVIVVILIIDIVIIVRRFRSTGPTHMLNLQRWMQKHDPRAVRSFLVRIIPDSDTPAKSLGGAAAGKS